MKSLRQVTVQLASILTFALALTSGTTACTDASAATPEEAVSAPLSTGGLPVGQYGGIGAYHGAQGQDGTYRVEYDISANMVTTRFAWDESKGSTKEELTMRVTWQTATDFTYTCESDPNAAGAGYCVDGSCHFVGKGGGNAAVDLTLVSEGTSLQALGSLQRASNGGRDLWREKLTKL